MKLWTKAEPEFFSPQVSAARRFYLNLRPSPKVALTVISGGLEQCAPDYEIHRDTFPFYSIEYVLRGRGRLRLNKDDYDLQPSTVFSYGPGIRQDIIADASDPPVKYFLDFSGKKALHLLRSCNLSPGNLLKVFPPNQLQNLFDELIRSGQRGSASDIALCVKLVECLVLKIITSSAPAAGSESLSFETYQQCRQYIERHFRELKTLQQIAAACHLDAAYLCRLFQRFDHQTPYRFLMRLKMNLAAEDLQKPGALIKQVAEQAGFGDQFHFSRAFKKVFGVPPDTFRRIR